MRKLCKLSWCRLIVEIIPAQVIKCSIYGHGNLSSLCNNNNNKQAAIVNSCWTPCGVWLVDCVLRWSPCSPDGGPGVQLDSRLTFDWVTTKEKIRKNSG